LRVAEHCEILACGGRRGFQTFLKPTQKIDFVLTIVQRSN